MEAATVGFVGSGDEAIYLLVSLQGGVRLTLSDFKGWCATTLTSPLFLYSEWSWEHVTISPPRHSISRPAPAVGNLSSSDKCIFVRKHHSPSISCFDFLFISVLRVRQTFPGLDLKITTSFIESFRYKSSALGWISCSYNKIIYTAIIIFRGILFVLEKI